MLVERLRLLSSDRVSRCWHDDLPGVWNACQQYPLTFEGNCGVLLTSDDQRRDADISQARSDIETSQGAHHRAIGAWISLRNLLDEQLAQLCLFWLRKDAPGDSPRLSRQAKSMHQQEAKRKIKPDAQFLRSQTGKGIHQHQF